MADKRISQLIERTDIANNDVLPIVASGATTTNKVTISTIQNWMQDNLDVGVTSVGITLGSSGTDVNVTGSPITTSGNITINIPTASATNRGLLSSADWSTFNGKQNSITLTTSGTSGAATLVGSTLNIPNYSTGVANAYVPYVGAIGSVTLGYNSLSASQINIDGASPTGGSYLGFKHSTSVNTGTDGYTSMYTFGTNTIAFKSVSGGNSKDFSFSMVGITPNVAGGRQYTLPDASGTLALTSDLDGYVTIGTTQTITGSKTFNSKIIGQDATLTSSGSTNTLEVFHTSGSGHAVEIQKAGNGEGLRVIKTSGSGNAVTISGGLLSAEAATFSGSVSTGRLTATGSDFHSFIVPGGTAQIKLERTSSSTGLMYIGADSDGFSVMNPSFSKVATISSTGAATFSGALNGTSASFSGNVTSTGGNFRLFNGYYITAKRADGVDINVLGFPAGSNNLTSVTPNDYNLQNTGGQNLFSVSSTGAATFSSSVTTATFLRASSGAQSNPTGGASVAIDYQSTSDIQGRIRSRDWDGGVWKNLTLEANNIILSPSGNVGIGTTSPNLKLQVDSTSGDGVYISSFQTTSGAIDTGSGLYFGFNDGTNNRDSANIRALKENSTVGNRDSYLSFGTRKTGEVVTEKMRLTSGGFLKASNTGSYINSAGAYHELRSNNGVGAALVVSNTNASSPYGLAVVYGTTRNNSVDFFIECVDPSASRFLVASNGNVTNTNNSYGAISDAKLKENIEDATPKLDDLMKVKVRNYNLIGDDKKQIGVIAQELEEVFPAMIDESEDFEDVEVPQLDEEGNEILNEEGEVVTTKERVSKGTTTKSVKYSVFVPMLIKAIQEQQEQIKSLTEQVEALKSQING